MKLELRQLGHADQVQAQRDLIDRITAAEKSIAGLGASELAGAPAVACVSHVTIGAEQLAD